MRLFSQPRIWVQGVAHEAILYASNMGGKTPEVNEGAAAHFGIVALGRVIN